MRMPQTLADDFERHALPRQLIAAEDLPKATKPEPAALDDNETFCLLHETREPTHQAKKHDTLSSEPWFYPAVAFSLYTGARRGEVLDVRWSDLNTQEMSVTIRRSLAETKTQWTLQGSQGTGKLVLSRYRDRSS